MGYNDEEYRSPRASKQYTSPKNKRKRKTKGQQLEESGEYLQDPETQDTSKPLESRMFDIDPKKHKEKQTQKKIEDLSKRPGTSAEGEAAKRKLKRPEDLPNFLQVTDPQAEELAEYDRLMRESKDLEGQEKIDKINEANRSRPNYGKMLWKPIQMLSDAVEWVDDQAGIPGTKIDVKHARNLITDPLDRLHPIAGLAGEILVPDTMDLLAGSGYVKRVTTNMPALIRAIKKTSMARDLNAPRILQNGYEAASGLVRTVKGAFEGVDAGTGGAKAMSGPGYIQGQLPLSRFQNVPYQKRVTNKMVRYGMKGGVMDIKALDNVKLGKGTQRSVVQDYLSPSEIAGSFDGFKKANQPEFATLWNDFLVAKGLKITGSGSDIQVHHINPLFDSIQLFDGVKFNSKEYWDVIETLIEGNARTGVIHRGEDVNNLMMTLGKGKVVDTPHGIAHKFLNSITPTFFSKAEMKLMTENPAYRLQKADEWAKIVNKGEQVILEAHKQWGLLNPKIAQKLSFDELVEELSKYDALGFKKGISSDFQLPDFNKIIIEIAKDKGLKGPIFRLNPKPVDLSKKTKLEKMIREKDIIDETRAIDKSLRRKPENPDQTNLDL